MTTQPLPRDLGPVWQRTVGQRVAHHTRCIHQTAEVSQATIGIIILRLRDMGPVWERVLGPEGTCLPPHLIAEVGQGMRGSTMEIMAGWDTCKGFLRGAFRVATWVLLRHRSHSSKSDDRSSGTYYPTRDSHIKRRQHHSRHGHVHLITT